MVWFKVDDGFYTSRKVLSIPRSSRLAAVGLWTMAGNWSGRELTDGKVPSFVLAELGATPRLRRALVEARLWLDHGSDGIEFSKWADYQPTREKVEADREKERIRKENYRLSQRDTHGTPASVRAESDPESQGASGYPDPTRPDPTRPSISNEIDHSLSPDESDDGDLIPADWRPNQTHIDKAASLHLDVKAEYQRFRAHAEREHRRLKNWNAGFTNWLRKQAEFAQKRSGTDPWAGRPRPLTRTEENLAVVAAMEAKYGTQQEGITS